jgi:hypothetical protein
MSMSTTTTTLLAGAPAAAAPQSRPGFFRRVLDRLTAAQEARARREIAAYLMRFSDARLAALGYTEAEIAALRRTGLPPASYWS